MPPEVEEPVRAADDAAAAESPAAVAESEAPVPARAPQEAAGVAASGGLDFVLDVPLKVTVEIGGARMLVRDVLQLGKGSVVELDRQTGEPADVLVNDRLVARGEVTVMDDRLAVKVVEVISTDASKRSSK